MTARVETSLRGKLIRKAHHNKHLQARVLPLIRTTSGQNRMLTARQRSDLVEAIQLVSAKEAKLPTQELERMPGFSPMQLRQHIDRLGTTRRELEMMTVQYKDILSRIKGLEKEEKEGLKKLDAAAREMVKTGNFMAEAESALIKFSAKMQNKAPGVVQMLKRPEETKYGEKAGDFFGRITVKLGADIGKQVEAIYTETKEDLTHIARAVGKIKILLKTSNLPPEVIKTAGLVDVVISIKEWMAGKARRLFDIVGDIGRWVKGFVERTKIVGKAKDDLKKSLDTGLKDIDKLLAGA
jgi:hypothetical protein